MNVFCKFRERVGLFLLAQLFEHLKKDFRGNDRQYCQCLNITQNGVRLTLMDVLLFLFGPLLKLGIRGMSGNHKVNELTG